MDASIFDSALSHTRRSDASEKREENNASTFGRFRMSTSFESSPVSVNIPISEQLAISSNNEIKRIKNRKRRFVSKSEKYFYFKK